MELADILIQAGKKRVNLVSVFELFYKLRETGTVEGQDRGTKRGCKLPSTVRASYKHIIHNTALIKARVMRHKIFLSFSC
jgi:hypothetical protein